MLFNFFSQKFCFVCLLTLLYTLCGWVTGLQLTRLRLHTIQLRLRTYLLHKNWFRKQQNVSLVPNDAVIEPTFAWLIKERRRIWVLKNLLCAIRWQSLDCVLVGGFISISIPIPGGNKSSDATVAGGTVVAPKYRTVRYFTCRVSKRGSSGRSVLVRVSGARDRAVLSDGIYVMHMGSETAREATCTGRHVRTKCYIVTNPVTGRPDVRAMLMTAASTAHSAVHSLFPSLSFLVRILDATSSQFSGDFFEFARWGQGNMLNVPFVGITSAGFITGPCHKNWLLWKVALSDAARGIIVSPYRNSQQAIYGTVVRSNLPVVRGRPFHSAFRRAFEHSHCNLSRRQLYHSFLKHIHQFSLYSVYL